MQPLQPLITDSHGVLRFKANAIVNHLLDSARQAGVADMNKLAILPFSQEDREQFAQLIGYSLSGFGELSYVSDDTYAAAEAAKQPAPKKRWTQTRITELIVATSVVIFMAMILLLYHNKRFTTDPQYAEGEWKVQIHIPPCDISNGKHLQVTFEPKSDWQHPNIATIECNAMPVPTK
jgi:hypothetical protein